MAKKKAKVKKNGPSILPLLAIAIIAFLVYRANPEYWQQGRLLDDIRKGGIQKIEQETVVREPVREVDDEPEIDPDASIEGSVKGAMTIPKNVSKSVKVNDSLYKIINSKLIFAYGVLPDDEASRSLISEINTGIIDAGLKKQYATKSLTYTKETKKEICSTNPAYEFLCENCDRKICLINGVKKEYIPLSPSAKSVLAKISQLSKQGW